jgi:hypothetical protein
MKKIAAKLRWAWGSAQRPLLRGTEPKKGAPKTPLVVDKDTYALYHEQNCTIGSHRGGRGRLLGLSFRKKGRGARGKYSTGSYLSLV